MSEDKHQTPIRIVVKKKGHGGHHGGAWKVAYADFVTAMMALFIVLWIVGQNNAVKQAISAYFKDPTVFTGGSGIHAALSSSPPAPVLFPKQEEKQPLSKALQTLQTQTDLTNREMEKLKIEGAKIEKAISSITSFEKFKDKIKISVTEEGMKIELIENKEGLFFDVGSAKVKPETVKLLKIIGGEIGKLSNKVIIEGHTDAMPYVTPGYSNWELSADRANSARILLIENGLKRDQVREIRGYADMFLKHPDKPNDFSNRRVNIIVAIPKQPSTDKTQQQTK